MTVTIALASGAALLYLASAAISAFRLFGDKPDSEGPRRLALVLGFAASVLHGTFLYHNIITPEGLNLSFFNTLSLVTWTIVLLLLLSSLSKPVENLGIVLLPLAALAIYLDYRFPAATHPLASNTSPGLRVHILVSILAYSLLALGSVQAVLLAIQDHKLRSRLPGGFLRGLPPLQTMESLLFEMLAAGFILLSLALASGFVYLEDMFAQHLVHKTVLSIAAWLVFGTLLWGRFRYGWRGRTALIWTLSGFVVLMLAYFGSKAVIELILSRQA